MNTLGQKIRLVYLRFLVTAVLFISGYTALHWWLSTRRTVFKSNDPLFDLVLPVVLPLIPVLIWVRPRVRLLKLVRDRNNWPVFYLLMATVAIIVPTIIAQQYVETDTGKMTVVNNPAALP